MNQTRPPHTQRTFALPPRWRWLSYTVLAAGGGTTTVTLLIEEEARTIEVLGPVAAIPLLGAPVVWLVRNLFNQSAPPTDRPSTIDKGHS
jgi:hypothetical protein